MKKFVFATLLALASISLVTAPTLRAQNSDQITIKDPAEFNSYQNATQQSDPKAMAAALESFLLTYPQSVVKSAVLDQLVDTYQKLQDPDKTLSAASRLLQLDPNNTKAIFISVFVRKTQCARSQDAQACDDAAALAQKGLTITKPATTPGDDWKKLTGATYPIYHSAIALDDVISKKDFKAGIAEYRTELMLYPVEQTTGGAGLWDTLQLAEAYAKQELVDVQAVRQDAIKAKTAENAADASKAPADIAAAAQAVKDAQAANAVDASDFTQAIWFYARAWNYATPIKAQIESKIDYYYKKYHGTMDGLDAVKAQAASSLFAPASFAITPAPTPADIAHKTVVETADLTALNLEDKEYILAYGAKEDTDKLWALLKDQITPVPGVVIDATATVIKLAVTQDAKEAKIADFIVNLKKPLEEKEIPAVGFEYKLAPATELIGTYDTFTQIPATATLAQRAEIVLRDGEIILEKKAAPAHKPAAGHRKAGE